MSQTHRPQCNKAKIRKSVKLWKHQQQRQSGSGNSSDGNNVSGNKICIWRFSHTSYQQRNNVTTHTHTNTHTHNCSLCNKMYLLRQLVSHWSERLATTSHMLASTHQHSTTLTKGNGSFRFSVRVRVGLVATTPTAERSLCIGVCVVWLLCYYLISFALTLTHTQQYTSIHIYGCLCVRKIFA